MSLCLFRLNYLVFIWILITGEVRVSLSNLKLFSKNIPITQTVTTKKKVGFLFQNEMLYKYISSFLVSTIKIIVDFFKIYTLSFIK